MHSFLWKQLLVFFTIGSAQCCNGTHTHTQRHHVNDWKSPYHNNRHPLKEQQTSHCQRLACTDNGASECKSVRHVMHLFWTWAQLDIPMMVFAWLSLSSMAAKSLCHCMCLQQQAIKLERCAGAALLACFGIGDPGAAIAPVLAVFVSAGVSSDHPGILLRHYNQQACSKNPQSALHGVEEFTHNYVPLRSQGV